MTEAIEIEDDDGLIHQESPIEAYKNADQKIKDIINGYIRNCQNKLLPDCEMNPYYFIPPLVNHLCAWFYRMKLVFKTFDEPMEISDDKLTVKLSQSNPRAGFLDEMIDVDKYTKVSFKIDQIGYIKIGLQKDPSTKDVYFKNRLNSNGQVCHNGSLAGEANAKSYKTGDTVTVIIKNKTMTMLINDTLVSKEWDKLDGKYYLGVGCHYGNDQVSLVSVKALNQ